MERTEALKTQLDDLESKYHALDVRLANLIKVNASLNEIAECKHRQTAVYEEMAITKGKLYGLLS